jgi:hypothetical protein
MGFLGALADQISSQFSLGENTNHTLDQVDTLTGKTVKYGSLGDFADHFDQSAERRYVEDGFLRRDPYNTDPKNFEILMQEPNATVLVKKRMFTAVADNFRPDFMDKDERLYYKAIKVLFQNKCAQIAALEKLSKIQRITSAVGSFTDQMTPVLISATDDFLSSMNENPSGPSLFGTSNTSFNDDASKLIKTVDRIRKIYAFNNTAKYTTWLKDSTNIFNSQFGEGTGVIEITNFTNLNTNVSVDLGSPGNFSFSISDPYEAMLITEWDIEKAISDASNMFYNSKFFQFGKDSSDKLITDLITKLNQTRAKRGAGPISFKIDPDTLLSRKVTAIIDRLGVDIPFNYDTSSAAAIFSGGAFGSSVQFDPGYLKGGAIAGDEGLDSQKIKYDLFATNGISSGFTHSGLDSELSIFNRLISTIYSNLSLKANSQNAFQTMNKDTNYARKKMRFNFAGKLIIQPMDTVHIYISSKTRYDNKLLTGVANMFSGLGMLQNINNTLTDLKNSFNAVFNPSGDVPLQVEKAAFVGNDFPNYLWATIRGQFVSEKEGAHVFAGIVDNATDNWSNGRFEISVSGRDNTAYFEMGKVNFKPGIDAFNGAIFDPLTPFKTNFDTITSTAKNQYPELLDENKSLLALPGGQARSSIVKQKLGRFAGQPMNDTNPIQDRSIDPVTGRITKVFYAPDGLVYKWKEGIGVFTQFGSNVLMNNANLVGNPNTFKEPFAGQGVMDTLSLLITGQPYNFATFFKAAQDFGGFYNDPHSGKNAAHTFVSALVADLSKNNTLWGNFVPFKNLVVDETTYSKFLQSQLSITQFDEDMNQQFKKLKELSDASIKLGGVNFLSEQSKSLATDGFADLKSQLTVVQNKINEIQDNIKKQNEQFQKSTGQDITGEATDFIDPGKVGQQQSDPQLKRYLRRQLNYLTRRMSYNVRANEDKNLFIVDDFYDKDFDVLAYEKSLTDGLRLYNNDFTSVKEKIMHVAQLLNLEVFCDTQGHIRCRPPAYNRMPSSVFYRMMYLKQALGIQVFPQFLDDLFTTKLETLRTRIEIIEDQIRLDCAILGKYPSNSFDDTDAQFFIITSSKVPTGQFDFISDPQTGLITEIQDLLTAANPDEQNNAKDEALKEFNNLKDQATSTKNVFTNSAKYTTLLTQIQKQLDGSSSLSTESLSSNKTIDSLTSRIGTKSGQPTTYRDYLVKLNDGSTDVVFNQVDVQKVVSELVDKVQERQKVMRLFYNTIKNAQEFKSLDDNSDQTGGQLLYQGNNGNQNIPEIFEHMIEDETFDDYGLGSGKRFVIKRPQIRSITLSENPPPWTTVEVHGILNPFLPNDLPEGLATFPGGGNGLVTALAIDYDMWRNYGFKEAAVLNVPFLSDPVSQCGPYATMLLSRARKDIFRGTVTISGNEYQQPGEVVFLEDRGMLFYVKSVKHSFTFGQSFTTTLELTYGHSPGEYIPTTMDVVGKLIYNNKDAADLVVHRQDTSANEINLGVILYAGSSVDDTFASQKSLSTGSSSNDAPNSFATANTKVINNILYQMPYIRGIQDSNSTAKLELRVYYDDNNGADSNLLSFASDVKNLLLGINNAGFNSVTVTSQNTTPDPLSPDDISDPASTTVNLSSDVDRRSPSQQAISTARSQANMKGKTITTSNSSNPIIKNDVIKNALFKYVIDCWVVVSPVVTNGDSTNRC